MNRFNTKGKRTYNISEIKVGDIVKFKGTRNKGFRKILHINYEIDYNSTPKKPVTISYFGQVLSNNRPSSAGWLRTEPYTSTNSVDKLSHVFKDGTWFKVIKDN